MPQGGPTQREYDLRRFPSKFNGKCAGCGEYYDKGDTVLWGKRGDKSTTYHDKASCVPAGVSYDISGGQQVPRSHTETPESPHGFQRAENTQAAGIPAAGVDVGGGHARQDPEADGRFGTRMLLARFDALESMLESQRQEIAGLRHDIVNLGATIEKAPF